MQDINKKIGIELQKVRESKDLSLREAAELMDISYSTIYSYERGVNAINVKTLKEVCDAYGTNYLDILQKIYYEDKLKEADSNGNL